MRAIWMMFFCMLASLFSLEYFLKFSINLLKYPKIPLQWLVQSSCCSFFLYHLLVPFSLSQEGSERKDLTNVSPFLSPASSILPLPWPAATNMELANSLGFPEKMYSGELMRGRGMETGISLAKAHLFLSLLPLGCFWLGTSTVLESTSMKKQFQST